MDIHEAASDRTDRTGTTDMIEGAGGWSLASFVMVTLFLRWLYGFTYFASMCNVLPTTGWIAVTCQGHPRSPEDEPY